VERRPIDPEQRRRQLLAAHARTVQRLAALRLPMYGLPRSWLGERHLTSCLTERGTESRADGSSTTTFRHTVELAHESADGSSYLAVETIDAFGTVAAAALVGDLLEFVRARAARLPDGSSSTEPDPADVLVLETTLRLDDRPTAFAVAQWQNVHVARWPGHAATVTVRADGWPALAQLALVRVTDARAYLDGRRQRLERASGLQLS